MAVNIKSRAVQNLAWRIPVGIFLIVSGIRGSELLVDVAPAVWQALQFGSAAIGLLLLAIATRPMTPRGAVRLGIVSVTALVVVAAIGIVSSIDPATSVMQLLTTALMLSFVVLTVLSRWMPHPTRVTDDLLFVALTIAATLLAGFVLLAIDLQSALGAYGRFTGFLSNANYAGALGALVTVLLVFLLPKVHRLMRIVAGGAIVITAAATLTSTSRTAILAMVVGVGVVLIARTNSRWRRALIAVMIAAGCVAVLLFPVQLIRGDLSVPSASQPAEDPTAPEEIPQPASPESQSTEIPVNPPAPVDDAPQVEADGQDAAEDPLTTIDDQTSGRLDIYLDAVNAWATVPILGTGFRTSPLVLDGLETHNLALSVLLETGLLGFAAFAAAFLSLLVRVRDLSRSRRAHRFDGLGPVAVVIVIETVFSSLFGWGGPTALLFWLVLAGFLVPQEEPAGAGSADEDVVSAPRAQTR